MYISPQKRLTGDNDFFEVNYTDDFKAALDEEYADYQKNGETISKEEVDKAIDTLLYGT